MDCIFDNFGQCDLDWPFVSAFSQTFRGGNLANTSSVNTKRDGTRSVNFSPFHFVDEVLSATELGLFISRHKILILSLIGVSIVGVFIHGAISYFQSQKYGQYRDQLHAFSQNELPQFEKEELDAQALLQKYEELTAAMGSFPGLAHQHLRMADALTKRDAITEAQGILEKGLALSRSPYLRYLYATRLAALFENRGNPGDHARAIEHLQSLLAGSVRLLESKTYLDLGRLYRLQGDNDKARASFEWVAENASEAEYEFKKMAQLYLSEL